MIASARVGRPSRRNNAAAAINTPLIRAGQQIGEVVETRRRPAEGAVMRGRVPDHAVERIRHLVGEEAGQPEHQVPEYRRDHPVAEILGQAFDRGARDAMRVEAPRVAADDVPHRVATGSEPALAQRPGDLGDVLEEAALGDKNRNQQDLDRRTREAAAAQLPDRKAEGRGAADQHDHGDDRRGRGARLRCEFGG